MIIDQMMGMAAVGIRESDGDGDGDGEWAGADWEERVKCQSTAVVSSQAGAHPTAPSTLQVPARLATRLPSETDAMLPYPRSSAPLVGLV